MVWNVQERIAILPNGKEKPTGIYHVSNSLGGEPSLTFNNKYVKLAIEMCFNDRKYLSSWTKSLYPDIAKIEIITFS